MFIFEDNNLGKITVYDFSLRQGEAKLFRMNEMSRIKKDRVPVYMVREYVKKGDYPIFSQSIYGDTVEKSDLAKTEFIPYREDAGRQVLSEFYNGNFTNNPRNPSKLIKVCGSDDRHNDYYLVGRPSPKMWPFVVDTQSEAYHVIKIPKTLYLLSLLEQGQLDLTFDEDISSLKRPIRLFDLEKVDELERRDIVLASLYGLTSDSDVRICNRLDDETYFVGQVKALKKQ